MVDNLRDSAQCLSVIIALRRHPRAWRGYDLGAKYECGAPAFEDRAERVVRTNLTGPRTELTCRFGSDVLATSHGAGGQKGRFRVSVWTSTSLRSCSAGGVGGIVTQYISRSVERRQARGVSARHCLRWNGFDGLSI